MYKNIFLVSIIFLSIDSLYLVSTKNYWNNQIKLIQGSSITMKYSATALCYLFLISGLYYFSINQKISNKRKLFKSFLLGLVIYGVFETTNWAIFNNWNLKSVIIDTLWGGILFFLTTYIYSYLVQRI